MDVVRSSCWATPAGWDSSSRVWAGDSRWDVCGARAWPPVETGDTVRRDTSHLRVGQENEGQLITWFIEGVFEVTIPGIKNELL